MATPPSHPPSWLRKAGEAATWLPGQQLPHLAAATACQWVSCRPTMLPLSSKSSMAPRLSAACEVLWSRSHRVFQEVRTVVDCVRAARD
eukprot:3476686-Heterocapsa_arctica.AAC.1